MGYQEGLGEPLNNLGNDQTTFRQIEDFAGDGLANLSPDEIMMMREDEEEERLKNAKNEPIAEINAESDYKSKFDIQDEPSNWEADVEEGGKYYDGIPKIGEDNLEDSLGVHHDEDVLPKTKADILGITAKDRQAYEDRRMMGVSHVPKPEKPSRDSIRFDEAV